MENIKPPKSNPKVDALRDRLNAVKRLQFALKFQPNDPDFMLTGSMVYALQGFRMEPNDIDIIINNPSDDLIRELQTLVTHFPPIRKGDSEDLVKYHESVSIYQFMYTSLTPPHTPYKIDVFTKLPSEGGNGLMNYDGITLSPLMNSVWAKQNYKRLKDLKTLHNMSKQIFNYQDPSGLLNMIKE